MTTINANGGLLGRKIELYLEDGATTDAVAEAKAAKLVAQDKVDVIFGGIYSSTRQAIKAPAVVKGRTLYIYPEQYEGQECDPLIFCTGPVPAQQLDPLVPWLMRKTGAKTFYLPSADYIWPPRPSVVNVPAAALFSLAKARRRCLDGAAGLTDADLRHGHVSVINVFGSWCQPCHSEHRFLMALAADDELKAKGVVVYGVAQKDSPENVRRFLGALGDPYARVGLDPDERAGIDWGVYGVPETFIVRGDGTIAYKVVGPMTAETLASEVKPQILKAIAAPAS